MGMNRSIVLLSCDEKRLITILLFFLIVIEVAILFGHFGRTYCITAKKSKEQNEPNGFDPTCNSKTASPSNLKHSGHSHRTNPIFSNHGTLYAFRSIACSLTSHSGQEGFENQDGRSSTSMDVYIPSIRPGCRGSLSHFVGNVSPMPCPHSPRRTTGGASGMESRSSTS